MTPASGGARHHLVAISRAPLPKLAAFKARMGWTFDWLSSAASDFNYDYAVSFTPDQITSGARIYNFGTSGFGIEEAPGISVFFRDDAGNIFHTYSCFARGLDMMNAAYHYLDLTPLGRHEEGLPYPMDWVRFVTNTQRPRFRHPVAMADTASTSPWRARDQLIAVAANSERRNTCYVDGFLVAVPKKNIATYRRSPNAARSGTNMAPSIPRVRRRRARARQDHVVSRAGSEGRRDRRFLVDHLQVEGGPQQS